MEPDIMISSSLTGPEQAETVKEAPLSLLIPTWILVLANIYFGINTELTLSAASMAVNVLESVPQ